MKCPVLVPVLCSYIQFFIQDERTAGITEEIEHSNQWKRPNLILEIPSRTPESSPRDYQAIKMPQTPKKVNFVLTPSPSDARINGSGSPGPSSSRGKSSIRSLFPKLSFIHRSSSDIEKVANVVLEGSSNGAQEKPSIARSLSLTKIFTPRIKRTSSLPVTTIIHSNPESTHGGSRGGATNLMVCIHLCHCSPFNRVEGSSIFNKFFVLFMSGCIGDKKLYLNTYTTCVMLFDLCVLCRGKERNDKFLDLFRSR